MKKRKLIIYALIIFIIGVAGAVIINSKKNSNKIVSGYSFELTKKNVINKKFDGKYLDSFVTIIEPQDQFDVNLEGINSDSNVFIINPTDGNMTTMEYKNGKFSIKVNLDKDINYGIIMDYTLIGSIRVVEDIDSIDENNLYTEILRSLGCGL